MSLWNCESMHWGIINSSFWQQIAGMLWARISYLVSNTAMWRQNDDAYVIKRCTQETEYLLYIDEFPKLHLDVDNLLTS